MALDNNLDGSNEIAHFLEKFKDSEHSTSSTGPDLFTVPQENQAVRPGQYARSFEKLEQKIHELEEKFEASTTQNHLILSELSRTREVMERQKDKDAFLEHLSRTIATLRTSVENLTRAQETNSFSYREPVIQRSFDPIPPSHTASELYAAEQETARLRQERDEQERLFSSLRQKASQLKAVNSALDREIKKAQQEKLDVLKKSADQAKEILSLRDQLTAAEERFKSFDFEGRIISIKREYQQKVSSLEIQLKEMSDTCMRQVEEIEALKAKNVSLQAAVEEKEALQAQLAQKDLQLEELKKEMDALRTVRSSEHEKQLAAFTTRLHTLEEQRTQLSLSLEKSQLTLGALRREKETLEKNFKELVLRINQNDAVISQLKEKIDVLARQNTELTHRNTALVQRNQELTQTASALMRRNEDLAQTNSNLTRDKQTLAQTNQGLAQEKETLARNNADLTRNNADLTRDNEALSKTNRGLVQEKEQLAKRNTELAREKEELTQTNLHLTRHNEVLAQKAAAPRPPEVTRRPQNPVAPAAPVAQEKTETVQTPTLPPVTQTQPEVTQTASSKPETPAVQEQTMPGRSAALLAARLVQEHAHKKAKSQTAKEHPEPVAAAEQNTSSETTTTNEPEGLQTRTSVLHSLGRTLQHVATPEEEEWEVVSAQPIRSEEDLPEIKVADPVPQDNLFDGEDFLEKTGSFIGRMKWSIFRENR